MHVVGYPLPRSNAHGGHTTWRFGCLRTPLRLSQAGRIVPCGTVRLSTAFTNFQCTFLPPKSRARIGTLVGGGDSRTNLLRKLRNGTMTVCDHLSNRARLERFHTPLSASVMAPFTLSFLLLRNTSRARDVARSSGELAVRSAGAWWSRPPNNFEDALLELAPMLGD
jgi:hypothetical protein